MIKRSIAFLITMYRIIIITTKKTLVKGGNQAQRDGHLRKDEKLKRQKMKIHPPHHQEVKGGNQAQRDAHLPELKTDVVQRS